MRAVLTGILSSGLLVACGGGGGGAGSAGSTPPPQATLLAINATNQDAVGRASAIAAATFLGASGGASAGTGNPPPLSAAAGNAGPAAHSIGARALHAVRTFADPNGGRRKLLAADGSARPLAIAPQTTPCDVSGSTTVSFVDADNNGLPSPGDTMTLVFDQCRDTPILSASGSMVITLSRVDVVGNLLSLAGALAMRQLTVTDGARTALLNGSLDLTLAERSATEQQGVLTVRAAGLSASVSGAGITEAVTFEPGFALTQNDTTSSTPGGLSFSSFNMGGGFSATSINGRALLETSTLLLQRVAEPYPYAGTLRVVGNGSALRLQALDMATVRLELDAALDGIYEASKVLAWATLLPR